MSTDKPPEGTENTVEHAVPTGTTKAKPVRFSVSFSAPRSTMLDVRDSLKEPFAEVLDDAMRVESEQGRKSIAAVQAVLAVETDGRVNYSAIVSAAPGVANDVRALLHDCMWRFAKKYGVCMGPTVTRQF